MSKFPFFFQNYTALLHLSTLQPIIIIFWCVICLTFLFFKSAIRRWLWSRRLGIFTNCDPEKLCFPSLFAEWQLSSYAIQLKARPQISNERLLKALWGTDRFKGTSFRPWLLGCGRTHRYSKLLGGTFDCRLPTACCSLPPKSIGTSC